MTWSDNWKNIESNEAKKILEKKRLSNLAISKILHFPQETKRRKVQKLIEMEILIKNSSSGIIYDERFVSFHKDFSTKFAKMVANFVLSLDEDDRNFFWNLFKLS
jgi:predicted transcriptional regulator